MYGERNGIVSSSVRLMLLTLQLLSRTLVVNPITSSYLWSYYMVALKDKLLPSKEKVVEFQLGEELCGHVCCGQCDK